MDDDTTGWSEIDFAQRESMIRLGILHKHKSPSTALRAKSAKKQEKKMLGRIRAYNAEHISVSFVISALVSKLQCSLM